ncbi:histidine phosphatase family protein [Candidatus Auribacterota bacterium]
MKGYGMCTDNTYQRKVIIYFALISFLASILPLYAHTPFNDKLAPSTSFETTEESKEAAQAKESVFPDSSLAPKTIFESNELTENEDRMLEPEFKTAEEFFDVLDEWLEAHPDQKLLVMVRHGESYSNLFRYVQSYKAFSPLTLLGIKQKDGMTDFFTARKIDFDRYITSDLERAHQIFEKLAAYYGKKTEVLERLRESIIWPIGGIPMDMAKKLHPGILEEFSRNPEEFYIPGLYSGRKVKKYLARFFEKISNSDKRKFIVGSHGMTILMALMELFKIDYSKYLKVYEKLGNSPNLGITVISYDPSGKWKLLVYADNSYLSEELRGKTTGRFAIFIEKIRYYSIAAGRAIAKRIPFLKQDLLSDYYPVRESFLEPSPVRVKLLLQELELQMKAVEISM